MAIKRKNGGSMAVMGARVALGVTAVIAFSTSPAIAQQNTERPLTFVVAGGLALASGGVCGDRFSYTSEPTQPSC